MTLTELVNRLDYLKLHTGARPRRVFMPWRQRDALLARMERDRHAPPLIAHDVFTVVGVEIHEDQDARAVLTVKPADLTKRPPP